VQGAKTRAQPKTKKTTDPLGEYLVWTQNMFSFVCSLSLLFVWVLQPEKIKNLIECVLLFLNRYYQLSINISKNKKKTLFLFFSISGLLF
jgi:hypothetical protein